jgi:hypothetical protein
MDVRSVEINSPAVIAESIDGEVIVMNLPQGIYYSLTGSAALAWSPLVNGASVADVVNEIAWQHGADPALVARDCAVFVQSLLAESIVRVAPGDAAPGALAFPPTAAGAPRAAVADGVGSSDYKPFGFERFDDMRAMLVIDPVHEVGDFGWPQASDRKDR